MKRQDQGNCGCTTAREPCGDFPALVRMNYFHGQLISERDLKAEQTYFRERLRHMNRCLHGYGILCGLGVVPADVPPECEQEPDTSQEELRQRLAEIEKGMAETKAKLARATTDAEREALTQYYRELNRQQEEIRREIEDNGKPVAADDGCHCSDEKPPLGRVTVECGAAIDCNGDDVVLRRPVTLSLADLLDKAGRQRLAAGEALTVYLSICHAECGIEPARPFALDSCSTSTHCVDSRVREDVRFTVSLDPPDDDERCETCCTGCCDACLLLAAISLTPGKPVQEGDIDLSGRRPIGLYHPVTITGVNWQHGAIYSMETARKLLGVKEASGGVVIRFSRGVHVSTLLPGVIDIFRFTGGGGEAGTVIVGSGEFADLPADGFVTEVRYRDTAHERPQPSDRVMIVVRGAFILDRCCRPVASAHVGGRVPALPGAPEPISAPDRESFCRYPPQGHMPWTTGPGAVFESWFTVADE